MTYSNKDKYEGTFENGLKHGKGNFFDALKGVTYDGDFVNGLMHGNGVFKWNELNGRPVDIEYKGSFENDAWHGRGELIWRESGVELKSVGTFSNYSQNGKFKLYLDNEHLSVEEWLNGKKTTGCNKCNIS